MVGLTTFVHRRVEAARGGTDPAVIARLASGWAVFGEQQIVPGYCLLLPDPVVVDLHELAEPQRSIFLEDMGRLGAALYAATGALRINYAMFGNQEPALHAHVIPRYRDEPAALRLSHPWSYDWSAAPRFEPDERMQRLAEVLRAQLVARTGAELVDAICKS